MQPALAMRRAIALSRHGYPAPNPRVGAVIVRAGEVVGEGWHEAAGEAHAEVVAIEKAGAFCKGATLYVSLEPCRHQGKTPPCTVAIRDAGITRVVYACDDPDPKAKGGAEVLRSFGIEVEGGLLQEDAARDNKIFLRSHALGRPYVCAKAAITLDGKIAAVSGESKWITGCEARKEAHRLRAEYGCVLIGGATALADDPSLTVRDIEVRNQPLRVVLDTRGDLPKSLKLFSDGGETIRIEGDVSPKDILRMLFERGVRGVLIEGGGKTTGRFMRDGMVDEVELHVAPKVLGGGVSWCETDGRALSEAWRLSHLHVDMVGEDIRIRGEVAR